MNAPERKLEEVYQAAPTTDDIYNISIFTANKPGVLSRIAMIFARRTFNINSIVASPGFDGKFTSITLTAQGHHQGLEQIIKQLQKLIDIIHVSEHTLENTVTTEVALIKTKLELPSRSYLLQLVRHFKAETVDITENSVIIKVTGVTEKVDAMIKMLTSFGILEIVRSGKVIMARGTMST